MALLAVLSLVLIPPLMLLIERAGSVGSGSGERGWLRVSGRSW